MILGCGHAGVINTSALRAQLACDRPILAVLGGMHLVNASAARLEMTIKELRRMGVRHLAPGYCTGAVATAALWTAFPERCSSCHVGSTFSFDVG